MRIEVFWCIYKYTLVFSNAIIGIFKYEKNLLDLLSFSKKKRTTG